MIAAYSVLELERVRDYEVQAELIREVRNGLGSRPRSLKPWMFYDKLGSLLFEQINSLPEYYPARIERCLLEDHAEAMVASISDGSRPLRIVELGAGSASKTCSLLGAAVRKTMTVIYVPLDISESALEMACQNVSNAYPSVLVKPLVENYVDKPLRLEQFDGATLILYLGSSIGNFTPTEAKTILCNLGLQLRSNDAVLLGTDLVKDEGTMVAAYDDNRGVTASFNLNVLNRLNEELDANFDLAGFRHSARWNSTESRIEMHLVSTRRQSVFVSAAGLELEFADDDDIHTENSYKFSDRALGSLLSEAGLRIETTWKDSQQWYAVTLARKQENDLGDTVASCLQMKNGFREERRLSPFVRPL